MFQNASQKAQQLTQDDSETDGECGYEVAVNNRRVLDIPCNDRVVGATWRIWFREFESVTTWETGVAKIVSVEGHGRFIRFHTNPDPVYNEVVMLKSEEYAERQGKTLSERNPEAGTIILVVCRV